MVESELKRLKDEFEKMVIDRFLTRSQLEDVLQKVHKGEDFKGNDWAQPYASEWKKLAKTRADYGELDRFHIPPWMDT